MALKFHNTLTGQKEVFTPARPPLVSFYTCGPTVYAAPHLGNLRTFVTGDLLRRALERSGFSVRQVINITDVDDKIIATSRARGQSAKELAVGYEQIFFDEIEKLNILRPAVWPRATEFIGHMIVLIEKLQERGLAYSTADGIYFKISAFPNYGRLKRFLLETQENPENDFALWKFHKPEDGEVVWDASFGRGRPGWHIECSAMIEATLGEQIDLHLGGTDLIFPHHENENAQTESLTGQPLSRFWLHSAFMMIDGEKMSKSLGNVIGLSDLTDKKFSPLDYRYLLLTAHYRTLLNFTWEALAAAASAHKKLRDLIKGWSDTPTSGQVDQQYCQKFDSAINDDLNLPQALAVTWQLVKDEKIKKRDKLATILNFDQVFGLDL
ncbi:MAG: cysteine--tRNA ligase, partial [Patescibacteria group bacterium]